MLAEKLSVAGKVVFYWFRDYFDKKQSISLIIWILSKLILLVRANQSYQVPNIHEFQLPPSVWIFRKYVWTGYNNVQIFDFWSNLKLFFRCLTYVREAAQRAATKSELHKTQIESLLGEKVGWFHVVIASNGWNF